jgi:uncharacterized membrane protein YgcG
MATELPAIASSPPATRVANRRGDSGPDRLTVGLFSIAMFLVVLAFLAVQLRTGAARPVARQLVVLRRIYRTTVIEAVRGPGGGGGGSSQTQSVSTSGWSGGASPVSTTRSS